MFAPFRASSFTQPLILLSRVAALLARCLSARLAEVYTELPSVDGLLLQHLPGTGGAGNIDEVGMGEASGLSGPPVDGNTDIHDVANVAEEVVEVLVGHFKRHVSDEKSLGGRVALTKATGGAAGPGVGLGRVELDNEVATFEDLHVEVVDGSLCVGNALELDVSETAVTVSTYI
jgi:hypothetical protein